MSESFSTLLDESLNSLDMQPGSIVSGVVLDVDKDWVTVHVGLKSEGRISLKEFLSTGAITEIKIGDTVEVYIERLEGKNGDTVLSREKARREEAWITLDVAHKKQERGNGTIFGKVKGGFTVDLEGATAFLPGS